MRSLLRAFRTVAAMFFCSVCVFLMGASTVNAATSGLREIVDRWVNDHELMGLAAGLKSPDGIDVIVYGEKDTQAHVPVEENDSFAIASVSKSFTAAAILLLVEEGRFSLSDSAATLSQMPIAENLTVENLLYHESPLGEYIGGSLSFQYFLEQHGSGHFAWRSEELVPFVNGVSNVGKGFNYSNTNYFVLGKIIESDMKLPLDAALRELLFDPLLLPSARLVIDENTAPDVNGHSGMLGQTTGSDVVETSMAVGLATLGYAAGGIAMNAADAASWAQIYYGGRLVKELKFLAADGEPFGLEADLIKVGPGVYEFQSPIGTVLMHGGDGLGGSALIMYLPGYDLSVSILTNDDSIRSLGFGKSGFLDELALQLLSAKMSTMGKDPETKATHH